MARLKSFLSQFNTMRTVKNRSATGITSSDKKKFVNAMAVMDKPNCHRFLEFFTRHLPLIGHASFAGELRGEKAHQRVKRSIL